MHLHPMLVVWARALRWGLVLCLACGSWHATAQSLASTLASAHHMVLMRHAYAPGVGDPPGYSLDRCESQRLLNESGKAQASRAGDWLRAQGIERAQVVTSPWCRCRQTAELLGLGPPQTEAALASFFDQPGIASEQTTQLERFLRQQLPAKGENALILVTHDVNIRAYTGETVTSGEMLLVRVDAQGRFMGSTRLHVPPTAP